MTVTSPPAGPAPLHAAPGAPAAPAPARAVPTPPATHAPVVGLSPRERTLLLAEALRRPELAWPVDRSIADARNAHSTNTFREMLEALGGEYDYLEGDIRVDGAGRIVMAHDRGQADGMSFDDWLLVGGASGRGLKMDVKEAAAIPGILQRLEQVGIDHRRLVLNVTALSDDATAVASTQVLADMRRRFPAAIINLSVSAPAYTPDLLRRLADIARTVGQPVMFPLKAELVTPEVVAALKAVGRIAIWNDPKSFSPADVKAEVARLRSIGVDGTIDLRQLPARLQ